MDDAGWSLLVLRSWCFRACAAHGMRACPQRASVPPRAALSADSPPRRVLAAHALEPAGLVLLALVRHARRQ